MMLIDIHPHVISDNKVKYPQHPLGGVQSDWSRDRPVTWEQLSAQMDIAGVDKAAVVQASTAYGHDNSYLADCVDRASERITGVCSIGITDDDVVPQMKHWINNRGLSGVRLFVTGSTMKGVFQLDHESAKPAWAWLAENGIPAAMNLDSDSLPQLYSVMEEFSPLRVVLDHAARINFGSGPPYLTDHQLLDFVKFPGVFLKVTTSMLKSAAPSEGGPKAAVEEVVSYFGSDRLAWGSNFPATSGTLPEFKALLLNSISGLSDADQDNICSRTALTLYPKLGG